MTTRESWHAREPCSRCAAAKKLIRDFQDENLFIFKMEIPEDVSKVVGDRKLENIAIKVSYKNHRGETGTRRIIPLSIFFGLTNYHPEEQWLLRVWDLDKNDYSTPI